VESCAIADYIKLALQTKIDQQVCLTE